LDKALSERVPKHVRYAGGPWWFALRLLAFWLLFFAFYRALFIVWLWPNWSSEGPWAAFFHAVPLDLSTAGYLVLLPILACYFGMAVRPPVQRLLQVTFSAFNLGLILFFVLAFTANVFLYAEWHTPLNSRAFEHFQTPGAVLDSMSLPFKIGGFIAYFALAWGWWRLFRKIVGDLPTTFFWSPGHIPSAPLLMGFVLLLIRGGVGKMPINESAVYYSTHPFNNHAATNTAWHFFHSLIEARSTVNHYRSMEAEDAHRQVEQLFAPGISSSHTESWLASNTGQRPNIVVIIMESMTAQVVEELGGEKGVCPNLGRLAQEGMLFTQCYGSGYRTDQGLVSVLSGFPAQPDQSVVLHQDKAVKLPGLSKTLRKEGYSTAFFYGGQLTFANIGTWLYDQQFQEIVSIEDFSRAEIKQLWGADDATLLNKVVSSLRNKPQPFFATATTLSLHQPYDVPYDSEWNGPTEREKFLNCAAFTDHAIGEFFRQAAGEPWFENTVFVLVADHGHLQPTKCNMDTPRARQVPLIITGPAVNPVWRGRRIETIGNHHDIPATLLAALGVASDSFPWSKNLLAGNAPDFAYYSNENGLGWITPEGAAFYRFAEKRWQNFQGNLSPQSKTSARAYLQTMYDDYLGL
jgi:phosphoglycerol transferase MdoB-like AlkP superfamily enzyme